MQTRKDLYQAHKLMVRRMATALLQGEPDLPESPMRRYNLASVVGVVAGALVIAVFLIIGLINPGGAKGLTDPGLVIVEEGTGATFVYSKAERRLIPTLNYTSARLIADGRPEQRSVSAESLAEYDRGPMVGIRGAPDYLPPPEMLARAPWSLCVQDAPADDGGRQPYVSLVGGQDVGGGPLGRPDAPGGVLVTDGRVTWLVWSGRRYPVPEESKAILSENEPRRVPRSWLNAFQTGSELRAPDIPERGERPSGLSEGPARIGQVLKVAEITGGPDRWYILLEGGIAQITPFQAALLLQDERTEEAYGGRTPEPIEQTASNVGGLPRAEASWNSDHPPEKPDITTTDGGTALCAVFPETEKGSAKPVLTAGGTLPQIKVAAPASEEGFADRVVLPPGQAAIAGVLPGDGRLDSINGYYLITDQGQRFATTKDVLAKLGYEVKHAAPVPTNLVNLVPNGPALSPAKARVSTGSRTGSTTPGRTPFTAPG